MMQTFADVVAELFYSEVKVNWKLTSSKAYLRGREAALKKLATNWKDHTELSRTPNGRCAG